MSREEFMRQPLTVEDARRLAERCRARQYVSPFLFSDWRTIHIAKWRNFSSPHPPTPSDSPAIETDIGGIAPIEQGSVLAMVRMKAHPKEPMAKVTSKYQVTLPKAIAERYRIRPGDEIDWVAAGDVIRVIPSRKQVAPEDRDAKLRLFDQATERHRRRPSPRETNRPHDRGWRREDLYERGRSR